MANAERISVSLDADLVERMREAGISPSALFRSALVAELGIDGPSSSDRLASAETALAKISGRVVKIERELRSLKRATASVPSSDPDPYAPGQAFEVAARDEREPRRRKSKP